MGANTWLDASHRKDLAEDGILNAVQDRLTRLARLPESDIRDGALTFHLQALHYSKHGHYYTHHDSDDGSGRMTRFLTMFYFLNDVPHGGELVFPIADEEVKWDPSGAHNPERWMEED